MKRYNILPLFAMLFSLAITAQETQSGHTNNNKFKQLYDEFATPNMFRTASGAPGPAYYQQQADYKMDITLDDANAKISGFETITYTNNSPDQLTYLWLQLDQNMRAEDSKTPLIDSSGFSEPVFLPSQFAGQFLMEPLDQGFNIESVNDVNGKPLKFMINFTMMRVELPKPMKTGDKFTFSIKWWYNINSHDNDVNNHVDGRGRSGYEYFE